MKRKRPFYGLVYQLHAHLLILFRQGGVCFMAMLSIRNNQMARTVSRHISANYTPLFDSVRKLSTGLRVEQAADDAAGLAIRELMRADIAALGQGSRNANDAISMIQVADGALSIIDEKLIRMKELAEQAATGTYDSTQRLMLDSEFQQMAKEIDRIARSTDFNGITLLDGTLSGRHDGSGLISTGSAKIHFGTANDSAEDYYYVDMGRADTVGLKLGGYLQTQEIDWPPGTPTSAMDPWGVYYADISTAANSIVSEEVTMVSVHYTGHKKSLGTFTNGAGAGLGEAMGNGLILSSGNVIDADSPPKGTETTALNQPGDSYLNTAMGGQTHDAAVLDIAFTAQTNMIYFNLVFATEEYPQFLNTTFNDLCGIFLDGPQNNYTLLDNIVSIDGQPVPPGLSGEMSLNNIFNNPDLFVDNRKGDNSFAANGFSRTFRVGIPVTPGQVHTLHISVADRSDQVLDSWILVNGISADVVTPEQNVQPLVEVKPIDIKTQEKAQYALTRLSRAIEIKDSIRGHLGAMQNRLENTVSNLNVQAENLQAAESRISDTDVAEEMTEFVRSQIITQSAAAMLSQANAFPHMLLELMESV